MQVAVYGSTDTPEPFLRVLYGGEDTASQAAAKYLEPYGIEFAIVEDGTIPSSPYISGAQTVTISSGVPLFSWDLPTAKQLASSYNSSYWQQQYESGIYSLSIDNSYQLALAIATPENERTADQVAAIEFMVGINGLQNDVQSQISAANTGEELITILNQLG